MQLGLHDRSGEHFLLLRLNPGWQLLQDESSLHSIHGYGQNIALYTWLVELAKTNWYPFYGTRQDRLTYRRQPYGPIFCFEEIYRVGTDTHANISSGRQVSEQREEH